MKAVIKARALAAAATGASGTLARKAEVVPIIGHIRIVAQGERLVLTATNLDEQISVPAAAEVAAEGGLCVPGEKFVRTVCALDPDAMVSMEMDGPVMVARCGRARIRMPTLPAAEFPDMVPGGAAHQFAIGMDALVKAFATVAFAISDEETRYYLNGVLWSVEGDRLWSVATDGHRLAAVTTALPDGAADLPDMILPKALVRRIVKRGAGGKGGEVRIAISGSAIQTTLPDGTTMISKLIDGSYPDWRRVMPAPCARILTVPIAALDAAVSRAATASDGRARCLRLDVAADRVRVFARSDAFGEIEEDVPAELCGAPVTFGFNAKYLRDLLAATGGETVKMHLVDPEAAVLVEGDDADARLVIMPMSV